MGILALTLYSSNSLKDNPAISAALKEYYESETEGFKVYVLLETKEERIALGVLQI